MVFKQSKVSKALQMLGLRLIRRNVHCEIYVRDGYKDLVSIPVNHKGQDIHINLLQRELRKVNLTKEEFLKVY